MITEWNRNETWRVVVACSETESTNALSVVKNGLIALRYLKEGNGTNSSSVLIIRKDEPRIKTPKRKIKPFLVLVPSLLLFCKIIQVTRKIVGIIRDKPPKPITKLDVNRSNAKDVTTIDVVKTGIAQIKNL